MRRPSLLLLLPALVEAGCSGGGCEDLRESERRNDFYVPWEEVEQRLSPDGTLSAEACAILCEQYASERDVTEVLECAESDVSELTTTADGTQMAVLYCEYVDRPVCIGGRRHASARPVSPVGDDIVMAWLQGTAQAETNSVKAFVALARELEHHRAPASLVARCREAACDEVGHARAIGALLLARGGAPAPLQFADVPQRSLVEIAVENAVEGCVMEVWASAVAHWQASHAADDAIRRLMGPIAADEARHGDLALEIHEWAMTQLDDDERDAVRNAVHEAVAGLLADLDRKGDGYPQLGVPTGDEAVGFANALFEVLLPSL
jgi:hypothetical protein